MPKPASPRVILKSGGIKMNMIEIIESYKNGQMLIVCDDQSRENECDLVIAGEHATPDAINFMATYGRGLICTPVPKDLALKLELFPMTENNEDPHQTAFTISIDEKSTTTGISAYERSKTIQALIKDGASASDFNRPGHVFPLTAHPEGLKERRGHTEAAVELSQMAGLTGVGVICEIMNPDGSMARKNDLKMFAKIHQLPVIDIQDIIDMKEAKATFKRISTADMPTKFGPFTIITYENGDQSAHHVALVNQTHPEKRPLVRIHSECLTGDGFGSLRCDCGEQLDEAQRQIAEHGHGAILYLRQEGRGIGLVNKIKAYALQDAGADTVEANHQLGFEDDLRRYDVAVEMLQDLKLNDIDLLTNNPKKMDGITLGGITVHARKAIELTPHDENIAYLKTKKDKMGHWLKLGGKS